MKSTGETRLVVLRTLKRTTNTTYVAQSFRSFSYRYAFALQLDSRAIHLDEKEARFEIYARPFEIVRDDIKFATRSPDVRIVERRCVRVSIVFRPLPLINEIEAAPLIHHRGSCTRAETDGRKAVRARAHSYWPNTV